MMASISYAMTSYLPRTRQGVLLLFLLLSCLAFKTESFQPLSIQRKQLSPRNVGIRRISTDCQAKRSISSLFVSRQGTETETITDVSINDKVTTKSGDDVNIDKASDVEYPKMEIEMNLDEEQSSSDLEENEKLVVVIMALCWGTAFLSALDRVAMSVALQPFSQEFGFTDTIKGQISALFSVGYGLAILPCGILVGSQSPRIIMGAGLALWSLATIATPLAAAYPTNLIPLLAARAAVGAAESAVLPSIQRILSSWIPAEKKATALATIFTGFQTGTIAAYLLSPFVMDEMNGWRGLFYLYGAVGLVWLVPWMLFAQDSPNTTALKEAQTLALPEAKEKSIAATFQESIDAVKSAPWKDLAKSPAVWAMTLAHAANNWGLYNNLAWTPTFYAEQYGLNVKDSALLSVLPSVAGAIGGLVAGSSADTLIRNLNADETIRSNIRKCYQGLALLGPAFFLATISQNIPQEPWVAQTLLMGTVGLQAFNAAGYQAANQEKAGEKWAGLLYSITSLPGVMFGSLGVYVTGQLLDATQQDWSVVFGLNAFVNIFGAAAFILLYNSKKEFD